MEEVIGIRTVQDRGKGAALVALPRRGTPLELRFQVGQKLRVLVDPEKRRVIFEALEDTGG